MHQPEAARKLRISASSSVAALGIIGSNPSKGPTAIAKILPMVCGIAAIGTEKQHRSNTSATPLTTPEPLFHRGRLSGQTSRRQPRTLAPICYTFGLRREKEARKGALLSSTARRGVGSLVRTESLSSHHRRSKARQLRYGNRGCIQ